MTTTTTGEFSCDVRPVARTVYQAHFASRAASEVAYAAAASWNVAVRPAAYVGAPVVPRSMTLGTAFTATGILKPRHTPGSYPVQIRCYRQEGVKWVLRKTVPARVGSDGADSRYRARVALPKTGSWRVYAHAPADAQHAAATSAARSVTVRK